MFSTNKFVLFPSLTSTSHLFVFINVFIVICLNNVCLSEDCKHITDCKCVFNNGSIVDLSSIGESSNNKPVWENVKAFLPNDTYEYSYNPCHKFSLGGASSGCQNVEVCQKSTIGEVEYYNVGSQAYPQYNNQNHTLTFTYSTTTERKTIVRLVCSPNAIIPKFEVIGQRVLSTYEMTLTSRCACADLCSERHLSGGSVLVILFLIFVSLYLILGIIHSSLTRGAHGWELIPHYEFWMDFPLLVRDGCVFVMSGCKPETAYERI